ncbi:hypothetical protein ACJZ2D_016203 [Fusarium nematophilum]
MSTKIAEANPMTVDDGSRRQQLTTYHEHPPPSPLSAGRQQNDPRQPQEPGFVYREYCCLTAKARNNFDAGIDLFATSPLRLFCMIPESLDSIPIKPSESAPLQQKLPLRLPQYMRVIRLKVQPPPLPRPRPLLREPRRLMIHLLHLIPLGPHRRIDSQLTLAALLKAHEPIRRLIDRLPHRQQPMVLQDTHFIRGPQHSSNVPALLRRQHHAPVLRVDAVRLVEPQRVLHHGRELLPEDGVGLTVG